MFLLDDVLLAPGKAAFVLFQELARKAQDEWLNDDIIKQELQQLYEMLEGGRISERDFEEKECRLLERLEQIARIKFQDKWGAETAVSAPSATVAVLPPVALPPAVLPPAVLRPPDLPALPPASPPADLFVHASAQPPPLEPVTSLLGAPPPIAPAPLPPPVSPVAFATSPAPPEMAPPLWQPSMAPPQMPPPLQPPMASPPQMAPPVSQPEMAPPQMAPPVWQPPIAPTPQVAPPIWQAPIAPPPQVAPPTWQPPIAAPPAPPPMWPLPPAPPPSLAPPTPAPGTVLTMGQIIDCAVRALSIMKMRVSSITAVVPDESGWRVTIELVERRGIPDTSDVLGMYDVRLDAAGNVLRYERTQMRRRGDFAR